MIAVKRSNQYCTVDQYGIVCFVRTMNQYCIVCVNCVPGTSIVLLVVYH